ncbi:hypothetical protein QLH51_17885 [Sphingomonas sp. 2R-10]|uniref:hypothetical protein n=1 Tax=Sphingomonas sp. 2R-10 TaxID=3045148 RepID=UPI000F76F9EA|nr:hypothetical protein [Sphingomonas sp. 2R-10]MDJ0278667.1 hypothetical protein [Sphingomonas sp. 2R-10]
MTRTAFAIGCVLALVGCGGRDAASPVPQLDAFASDDELRAFVAGRLAYRRQHPRPGADYASLPADTPMPPPVVAAPAPAEAAERAEPSITNTRKASCVDWYGNARPIFLRGRIFALMGYELVEGRLQAGRIAEVARTDFAPPAGVR